MKGSRRWKIPSFRAGTFARRQITRNANIKTTKKITPTDKVSSFDSIKTVSQSHFVSLSSFTDAECTTTVTQKLFKRPLKDVYGFERKQKAITFLNSFTLFAYFSFTRHNFFEASCHHLSHTRNHEARCLFFSPTVCAGFMLHNLCDSGTYSAVLFLSDA
jgi:hypothetical protein